jgi:hypothetical protein
MDWAWGAVGDLRFYFYSDWSFTADFIKFLDEQKLSKK